MRKLSLILVGFNLLLAATSLLAEGSSIRGVVTDASGKPIVGAEIRAERVDTKGTAAVAVTDAKGQYALDHLAVGTYNVTASVYKTPRSTLRIKTNNSGWVNANFALKGSFARQHHDQSATDRIQGQDLRRMQQDQGFGH